MQAIGQNPIDYWQRPHPAQRGLQNRFGVRVRDGRCWALIQIGDEDPFTYGKAHDIPVDLSMLPSYLRMIVDDHLLNDPSSDLVEVLAGRKSLVEPKQMSASGSVASTRFVTGAVGFKERAGGCDVHMGFALRSFEADDAGHD